MRHLWAMILALLPLLAWADPGDLDLSFANKKGVMKIDNGNDGIQDIHALSLLNGKTLLYGGVNNLDVDHTSCAWAQRLNVDGTIDNSFNKTGTLVPGKCMNGEYGYGKEYSGIKDAAEQADGRLVLLGNFGLSYEGSSLRRINDDGSADADFGGSGYVTICAFSDCMIKKVLVQADQKVVTLYCDKTYTGTWECNGYHIKRFHPDGSPDVSFGVNGVVDGDALGMGVYTNAIVEQAGRLIVTSADYAFDQADTAHCYLHSVSVRRLMENGAVDTSFGASGVTVIPACAENPWLDAVKVMDGGKLVVVVDHSDYLANKTSLQIYRLMPNGQLDIAYGVNGKADVVGKTDGDSVSLRMPAMPGSIVVGSQGDVFMELTSKWGYFLQHINSNGVVNTAIGDAGFIWLEKVFTEVEYPTFYFELQNDGKILGVMPSLMDQITYKQFSMLARFHFVDELDATDGEDNGEQLGTSVAVGDLDGDGVEDVVASAPSANVTSGETLLKNAGHVRIISGKTQQTLLKIRGGKNAERLGAAVAVIADQNGDGLADIVLGEPSQRRVSLYSGATGARLKTLVSNAKVRDFGAAVAVGDVNKDGIADLLVGAPGSKAVLVYDGTALSAESPLPLYVREGKRAHFGAALAVDQQHRLLVGSPKAGGAGMVDVFDGADGKSAALFTLTGQSSGDDFGKAVSVRADGAWVVGSPGASPVQKINGHNVRRAKAGRVQVYSSLDASLLETLQGNAAGDAFGSSLAGGKKLLVGAATANVKKPVAGKYMLLKKSGKVMVAAD